MTLTPGRKKFLSITVAEREDAKQIHAFHGQGGYCPFCEDRYRSASRYCPPCEHKYGGVVTVCVSGNFNPIHVGHLRYLEAAREYGAFLIAIVNNDRQVALKGSVPFMSERDRADIVYALDCVDFVLISVDDDLSVGKTLLTIKPDIFANGGDATEGVFRERDACEEAGIVPVFGVGGTEKLRSSSELLRRAASHAGV